MQRVLITSAIVGAACVTALSAGAQGFYRSGQQSQIQSSFSSQVPLLPGKDEVEQQLDAVSSFYKVAAASCREALASVADSCELSRLTINVRLGDMGGRGRFLSVTGQTTMDVKFKTETGKNTPPKQ